MAKGPLRIAIACQGGGSHAAFTAGALDALFEAWEHGAYGIDSDHCKLVGLSGTSGGAISALAAWSGYLTGSWAGARERVTKLWDLNAATTGSALLWNVAAVSAARLSSGAVISPYLGFGNFFESLQKLWMPEAITNLPQLLQKAEAFRAVEPLEYIERDDQSEKREKLERAAQRLRHGRFSVRIDDVLAPDTASIPESKYDSPMEALEALLPIVRKNPELHQQLRAALSRYENNAADGSARSEFVTDVDKAVPRLLVGAVATSGEFKLFDSSNGDIDEQSVVASTAIPWLTKAVERRGTLYYDGLYSYNPPIAEFVTNPHAAGKPHELWVIQLNPARHNGKTPSTAQEILDRNNELIGNLSLEHEISKIELANDYVEHGAGANKGHALVRVMRLHLDSAFLESADGGSLELDYASKVDRDQTFLDALRRHGRLQAQIFLLIRQFIAEQWESDEARAEPFASLGQQFFEDKRCRVVVRNVELKRGTGGSRYRAIVTWRASGPLEQTRQGEWIRGARTVEISGCAEFGIGTEQAKAGMSVRSITSAIIKDDAVRLENASEAKSAAAEQRIGNVDRARPRLVSVVAPPAIALTTVPPTSPPSAFAQARRDKAARVPRSPHR